VIIGRFFLQVAAEPNQQQPQSEQQQQQQQQQSLLEECITGQPSKIAGLAGAAQQWLQAHSTQLTAAGYNPEAVLLQLHQLLLALDAVAAASPAAAGSSVFGQLLTHSSAGAAAAAASIFSTSMDERMPAALQQLRLTGLAVCGMAVPCLCNNPSCANTTGLTELSLVSGRSCICAGCRVARYCSRPCRARHWKQHKPVCAALAAASSAANAVEV
jgi:hypothetical protein